MEMQNNIINELTNLEQDQTKFIKTTLGKVVNNSIDIGLRYAFPDFIEEEIIDVKDSLINYGLKEGINTAIEKAINIGKSMIGIFTGKFENISQIRKAVEGGGIIDTTSNVIDFVTKKARDAGVINNTVASLIRESKNSILNNISSNIEKELSSQEKNIEKLEKYSKNWKEHFERKDFNSMQKEYIKIKEKLQEMIPIENTIRNAKTIETIHNIIKNNGQNFNLTEQQIELAQKLNIN